MAKCYVVMTGVWIDGDFLARVSRVCVTREAAEQHVSALGPLGYGESRWVETADLQVN